MSEITRSEEATSGRAAARVARARVAQPSGWWGMALLIATEATLFGALIATYFYLRFSSSEWPLGGIDKPSVTLPLVLTGGLLASAIPVSIAVRAARGGCRGAAWLWLAAATVVQAVYLGLQIHLFVSDLGEFRPEDNAYGSIYFTLLGVHHVHVAIGLALSAFILARLAAGLTNYRMIGLRSIALYWYFVAAVGVAVTLTSLYPSL